MALTHAGVRLHYEIDGAGPWLTLSHSLAASSQMWAPQMAALSRHFSVLRIDTRGHGLSSAPPGPYSLGDMAADVIAVHDHLGITRSHWLGLSLGGMIGQVLALAYPGRLASLVLADTTGRGASNAAAMWSDRARIAREQGMAALVTGTMSRWLTEPFRAAHPEVVESLASVMRATDVQGYGACCAAIAALDTLDQLHTLDLPALVLVGAQDEATPPQMSRDLQALLRGAELAAIEGAAHISSVEQADEFNRLVLDFLLRVGASASGRG